MASTNIVTLTQENFAKEVLQSSAPVLVDFWAEWCGPCKQIAPALGELATEYDGKAKIAKVNIEEATNQQLAVDYGIRSIPTFILFKGGQVVAQHLGIAGGKPKLKSLLDGALD
jgi:thioredoxin 1